MKTPELSVSVHDAGEERSVSVALQMVVKDGEGWTHQADTSELTALGRQFEQGSEIGDGETRRGQLAYQVPEDAEELYWAFEFDLLADGTKTFCSCASRTRGIDVPAAVELSRCQLSTVADEE